MPGIETVEHGGALLAMLIRRDVRPAATTFPSAPEHPLQLGFVVYPAGGEVARHRHLPLERRLTTTSEVILVREGACLLDVYDLGESLLRTWELSAGDVVLLLAGGHGFRMTQDTVLLEVKQGPYTGLAEKERF